MTIATLYISLDLLTDVNLFQTSKHLSSPVTLSMSCKEASPESIGAVGKHSVVASCQNSQVSALVGLYIPHSCCVKEMTNRRYGGEALAEGAGAEIASFLKPRSTFKLYNLPIPKILFISF